MRGVGCSVHMSRKHERGWLLKREYEDLFREIGWSQPRSTCNQRLVVVVVGVGGWDEEGERGGWEGGWGRCRGGWVAVWGVAVWGAAVWGGCGV